MTTVPDRNGDGIPEIAVLAVNKESGLAVVRVFDPVTGKRLRQYRFPVN